MQATPNATGSICTILQRGAPDATALIDGATTWTYAQLRSEAGRHAAMLAGAGVRAGDRVMLVSENCAAQVALIFAIASLQAWVVNVNARLSPGELATIEEHSGARLVVRIENGDVQPGPLNHSCVPDADLEVAALIYTTGTTGDPKGVMLTHANLLFVAQASSTLRAVVASDRAYGVLPISHVYGLTSVLLGTLYAGACLVLEARFTPAAMLAALPGLTILQGVPAMYARLLDACAGASIASIASGLRFIYAGGSPLDPDLKARVEQAFGLPLHNGYGLTETAPTVSQTRLDAPRSDTSVGMAIPGVEVKLVAEELWVRGPNVMRGYYRGAAVAAGSWFNTGDMARIDADGAIFITGRTKELIIRAGFNVYPLEVETAINAHPDVALSAVVGRAMPDGDEEVVAYVQARAGCAAPDLENCLRVWLTERLAPYKRPAHIVFIDALPAAANGKVLKLQLL